MECIDSVQVKSWYVIYSYYKYVYFLNGKGKDEFFLIVSRLHTLIPTVFMLELWHEEIKISFLKSFK